MITTVCLNPSIDRMIRVEGFQYGGLNRVVGAQSDAGGKGVNVAVSIAGAGGDATCVSFMYRESEQLFANRLSDAGAAHQFVLRDGSARTNLKVLNASEGVVTEFNESGRAVGAEDLDEIGRIILQSAARSKLVVLSGSMPPGCPAGYYAALISDIRRAGCRCVLDADGEPLKLGVEYAPYLIKPNRFELEMLAGRALGTVAAVRDAARDVISRGVAIVAVSLGAEGAMIADAQRAYFARPLDIPVRSTVGAGDAMVAGLSASIASGAPLDRAFASGVACASAMCMTEGTQPFRRDDYLRLLGEVRMEEI